MSEEALPPTKPQPTMTGSDEKAAAKRRFNVSRYALSPHSTRRLCYGLAAVLLLVGAAALILYLVYRPSKPRFSVASAAVFDLRNASNAPPNVLSTSMQFTLVARNPSDRSAVLFDRLSIYAAYRNQPVTPPAELPPLALERGGAVAVSPVLGGVFVPVSPNVAAGIIADREFGVVGIRLVLLGRVRYRSGPFRSVWTGLYVRCDVLVGVRKGVVGQVPLLGEPQCDVDA